MSRLLVVLGICIIIVASVFFYGKQKQFSFTEVGNDSAKIELHFFRSGHFELVFNDLQNPKDYLVTGVWVERANDYEFTLVELGEFRKEGIDQFFDVPQNPTIKKVPQKPYTFSFNKSAKDIVVWGVTCEKR